MNYVQHDYDVLADYTSFNLILSDAAWRVSLHLRLPERSR